jgi:predicted enzyme related to lactoylglutathione lyase
MSVLLTGGGPEIGVVVRDPTPMLHFYRDYLGLALEKEMEFPGIRLWWLCCGGGSVKLVHMEATPGSANAPGGMQTATGLRYITLVVDNVEEVAKDVESAGGQLLYSNTMEQLTMAMLEDPEGNHVELVRWN